MVSTVATCRLSVPPFNLSWNGRPVHTLPQETSKWTASSRFTEVDIAFEWKMKPSEFWASSASDQAYMTEYIIEKRLREAYDQRLQNEEMQRNSKPKARPPRRRSPRRRR